MAMSKKTTFTTISPLPPGITREAVLSFLHNHVGMIDLNPLVIERHPIAAPPHAPAEEQRCVWWSMTDKISYLPGNVVTGDVTYTAAFNDLPNGIQTHVYAPMGTDIRERWTLNGSLPGEPAEPVELGIGAPRQGLYLREDVELRCNFVMSSFVKKTLKKAHGTLVDRLLQKSQSGSTLAPVQAPLQAARHHHTGSSVNSGSAHSIHSRTQSPFHSPHSSQYGGPLQQQQQQSRPASNAYSHTSSPPPPSNSYGHTPPPPPPGPNAYGRTPPPPPGPNAYNRASSASPPRPGSSTAYSNVPPRSTERESYVPEPLRINKSRASSGQYPQGQQQTQNGGWSDEKAGFGYQPPKADGNRGFVAELE